MAREISKDLMTPLLYEESTQTRVDLIKEQEVTRVKLTHEKLTLDELNSGPIPTVDKDRVALHKSDVYVLDSTKSGPGLRTKESGFYGRVLRPLFDEVFKVKHTYVATTSSTSIAEFSSTLLSNGRPILMLIIAGDTSVCEFVNALSEGNDGRISVFVIPAGTGNSLSLSLGIVDEGKAIQRLFQHTESDISPLHMYYASFPDGSHILQNTGSLKPVTKPMLFVVVASWAFHASLVADSDTEEMRKHGLDRFKIAAHDNLAQVQKYDGKLTISDEDGYELLRNGPFAYLVVTPSQKFEPTFEILPRGNIFDSDLYVVGFQTQSDEGYIVDIMKKVYDQGCHIEDERVFYDRVQEHMTITLNLNQNESVSKRRFCVDGAVVVVPDKKGDVVNIGYHGSKVHGWSVFIVN